MRSARRCFDLIIILIAVSAVLYTQRVSISNWMYERSAPELPVAMEYEEVTSPVILSEPKASEESPQEQNNVDPLPLNVDPSPLEEFRAQDDKQEMNLAVPFTSQAPHGNWSEPYKEACEEASLYMVHAYYQGVKEKQIDPETAMAELQKIVAFEKELFGFYEDTTTVQTATLAELMYGYAHVETIDDPTVSQIKTHVAAGRPVIVPLAGRELGNPFYTAPGPIYHMLVIRGYTQDGKFITNDPGTKHGEAYLYDFDTVMNAMHDWNGGEEITEGKKVVLIIYP